MKCNIIILLWLAVLTSSCEKITNIKLVEGITKGSLSYRLTDDAGNGLAGVSVSLHDPETRIYGNTPEANPLLFTTLTDKDGIAYFSDLNPQNYLVKSEPLIVNKNKYYPLDYVQIVADQEKKRIVKVSDFSGSLDITLISSQDYKTPVRNVGVVAFPIWDVTPNSTNVTGIIKDSPLKGVTDANGFVSIKVPSNVDFDFIVYNLTNGNLGYGYTTRFVEKDGKTKVIFYAQPF